MAKGTSWRQYVMTSKSASWRQNTSWCKSYIATSNIRHDVKMFVFADMSTKAIVLTEAIIKIIEIQLYKTFHNLPGQFYDDILYRQKYVKTSKYVIMSKLHRDVKNTSWRKKVRHIVKSTSCRQRYVMTSKVRHDVKIRHDVKNFVMTSKSFYINIENNVMPLKSPRGGTDIQTHTQTHTRTQPQCNSLATASRLN